MLNAAELKALLSARGLCLTRRLGQHHLIDVRAIERIADAAGLGAGDRVVEIGAGLGAVTEALARRAGQVEAVEVDAGICEALRERMAPLPNVRVSCRDILTYRPRELDGAVIVGAVPYHITSDLIVWLCDARRHVRRAVLVVQKEVGQRLAAGPGTKAYGRLSLLAQYSWQVRQRFTVGRHAFFPQPDVDSVCVSFDPLPPAAHVADERLLFAVIKAAFGQRRKTLVNSLDGSGEPAMSRARAARVIERLGWPAGVRGESLSLEDFVRLTEALADKRLP
jgi:16S rRNA (adenine1518-N6/adenine1519-N6)-dimethyltransferase